MIATKWHREQERDAMREHADALTDELKGNAGSRTLADSAMSIWRGESGPRWHHFQRMESLGRLAMGVAHEFNNLLTVIGGSVEMLRERVEQTDDGEDIREIQKAIDRAAGLAQQLLSFGRNRTTPLQPVDLTWVLKGMSHALLCLTGTRVGLEANYPNSLCPVCVRPQEIEQVVLNLVINACDAIQGTGKIQLEIHPVDVGCEVLHQHGSLPVGRYACLTVRDNGCGMDAETQQRLFEPFYTTKDVGKGTGLGMAIVWDILKRSEGQITVHSEPGQGSRFDVYWPLLAF